MGESSGLERGWWKLPTLSGVLVGLSYFPGPFLPLNLAGFLPLLVWIDAHPPANRHAWLKAGFLFGMCVHLTALHFMYSMLTWSWLAALLYVGMAAALAVRISLSVLLLGWLRRRTGLPFGLLLPLCWLPLEWAQTWGDLRMTGEHLAHTVAGYPFLVQFADLVGPYGVGACLLAVNGLLFDVLGSRGRDRDPRAARRARAALAALVAVVLGYNAWAWFRPEPEGGTLRVALIQPNIPLMVKRDARTDLEQWNKLAELTRRAAEERPDLIVWPESARPQPLYHRLELPGSYVMPDVQSLARQIGVPLLVGAEYVRIRSADDYEIYNAALAVDAEGRLLPEWGAKIYLVPFVEATPFAGIFGPLVRGKGGEWKWLAGTFTPGPTSAVLDVAGTRVGVLVCYEQLFFDLPRRLRMAGSRLQVVITNDAWFGRSLFQAYQANALRLRAIEGRTAFVRAANTGISGFVDRRGRYHERTRLFEEAVEVYEVALSSSPSVYHRLGDVVAWLAVAGLLATCLLARRGQVLS